MRRSQEIICALALILWCVMCGNWHLEGKIARQERKYQDRIDAEIERAGADEERIARLHEAYAAKTREVFSFEG